MPMMFELQPGDHSWHFYMTAIQYYVSARSAAIMDLSPVAVNLYHHAVEMLLKGHLTKSISLDDLKKKFRHNLVKTWNVFKSQIGEDLSSFDPIISDLHKFEDIRYPDKITKDGAVIRFSWDPVPHQTVKLEGGYVPPHYQFAVTDADRLLARLFPLCGLNPREYMSILDEKAKSVVAKDNPVCQEWFTSPPSVT
jgi:hypothetical protein